MRPEVYVLSRPQKLFVVCTAIFITALVIAEATSTKFFTAFKLPFPIHLFGMTFGEVVMTTGVLAFPVTFIITDLMNEYFGKKGIRFVTLVGMVMIGFEFLLLQAAIAVPAASISPVSQEAFEAVFGTTGRIILGSLTAYLLGQLADITLFHWLRGLTRGRFLWLRATGSTFGSQFIDTFVVLTIAFAGQLAFQQILAITLFNYGYKLLIAIAITPLIYLAHWAMDAYLGKELAHQLTAKAAARQDAF
ncbi:queuosine precursor transporter [Rhodothermus bifroesti]|uniref:Probable queuosine precursor transporter n=1 Tax=Rhodothermus marinus TaxID=29549 RepID=A0A7V2F6Q4_RHOMR|nr:queuosine precursor transporter [Rhodothermus bifroesti]GBD00378.1 Inner membrane protein YhhQ [bacterium HR18]